MASEEVYERLAELTAAHNACVRKLNARIREVEARCSKQADELAKIKVLLGISEKAA